MATSAPRSRKSRRADEVETDTAGGKPKSMFQWLLLYPAFGVALLTAGPQWYDRIGAFVQKTGGDSLAQAKQQNELWRKNISCLGAPSAWFESTANVKIDATICDSGDIFVQAMTPDNKPHMSWIALDDVVKKVSPGGIPIVGSANAATPQILLRVSHPSAASPYFHRAQAPVVLCQRFIDDRHVMRRVQTPQGCFDEIIDTFNGSVVQRNPAPCVAQCG
jgi:hypothetical protein